MLSALRGHRGSRKVRKKVIGKGSGIGGGGACHAQLMMLLMRGSNKSLDFLKISFDRERTAGNGGAAGGVRGNRKER